MADAAADGAAADDEPPAATPGLARAAATKRGRDDTSPLDMDEEQAAGEL